MEPDKKNAILVSRPDIERLKAVTIVVNSSSPLHVLLQSGHIISSIIFLECASLVQETQGRFNLIAFLSCFAFKCSTMFEHVGHVLVNFISEFSILPYN